MEEKKSHGESEFDKGFNRAVGGLAAMTAFVLLCFFIPKIHSAIKGVFNPNAPAAEEKK